MKNYLTILKSVTTVIFYGILLIINKILNICLIFGTMFTTLIEWLFRLMIGLFLLEGFIKSFSGGSNFLVEAFWEFSSSRVDFRFPLVAWCFLIFMAFCPTKILELSYARIMKVELWIMHKIESILSTHTNKGRKESEQSKKQAIERLPDYVAELSAAKERMEEIDNQLYVAEVKLREMYHLQLDKGNKVTDEQIDEFINKTVIPLRSKKNHMIAELERLSQETEFVDSLENKK